jgi:DNA-binding MarR family transcriptional regulator
MSRLQASGRGDEPTKIAGRRLSTLQKRLLCWIDIEERRTNRIFSSNHQELVQSLPHAKGNISHSLRRLEAQGLVDIGRSPGGQTQYVRLTSQGCQKACELAGSYD